MSITHTQTISWRSGSGTGNTATVTVTGDTERNASVAVPAGATDFVVALAFTASKLQECFLLSDQAVVLKTNSISSPGQTITLAAGTPLAWSGGGANPFSVDVTNLHFVNAGTSVANVTASFLVNN